jgi:ribosomal protein S18 acetylase RimI-like enzyme
METDPNKESGPGVVLRQATEGDIETLIALEKSVSGKVTYSPMLESDEWREAIGKGPVYLIEYNGAVVGDISYEPKAEPDHFELSGIMLMPEYQGQGIGGEALRQILAEMGDTATVELVVHPDNPAIILYKAHGFVFDSQVENYFDDGQPRQIFIRNK